MVELRVESRNGAVLDAPHGGASFPGQRSIRRTGVPAPRDRGLTRWIHGRLARSTAARCVRSRRHLRWPFFRGPVTTTCGGRRTLFRYGVERLRDFWSGPRRAAGAGNSAPLEPNRSLQACRSVSPPPVAEHDLLGRLCGWRRESGQSEPVAVRRPVRERDVSLGLDRVVFHENARRIWPGPTSYRCGCRRERCHGPPQTNMCRK